MPATWSLNDVSLDYTNLDKDRDGTMPSDFAAYDDLQTGQVYGTAAFTPSTPSGADFSVMLNGNALSAINSSIGSGDFLIGGTLSTVGPGPGAPGPLAGLGILPALAALAGLGFTRVRRRAVRVSPAA